MDADPKPKSNAVLKTLPEDRQAQIAEWCMRPNDVDAETGKPIPKTGGLAYARMQLAADGVAISIAQLGEFFSWWRRRQRYCSALSASEHQRELMEAFRPGDLDLAREFAEFTLLQAANEQADPKLFATVANAQDSRRMLTQREKQIAQKDRQITQKDKDLALAERRVAVLEQKMKEAQAALDDKTISAAEQAARIREIFKK